MAPKPRPSTRTFAVAEATSLGAPGAATVNLTLILTGTDQDEDEAAAVGGIPEKPGSLAKINELLNKHPSIGTLSIISHGGSDGTVVIGGVNMFLTDIAAALDKRPAGSINRIQFLGCNIGKDKPGMRALKAQLGALVVEGTDCSLETQRLLPARRNGGQGKEILTRDDLPKSFPSRKPMTDAEFGTLLIRLIPNHVDVKNNRIKAPDCILGFGPGTKLANVDPATLAKLYFDRSGKLIFRFVPGGACWDDLKFDKPVQGCMRVSGLAS